MVRSPLFEMAPSLRLPPVDFCSGVSPSQAAKSRPARKPSGAGTRAVIAVAAIRPMPGIVMDHGKDSDEILTHRPAWLTGEDLSPNRVCTKPC